ncbi:Drug/metabolite transporter [Macleaya cordata]|uniref:WAT1-related protein n=1 Tax=Macleaya cordata TaxID=56857 RepID=A0A200R0N6_MACCD|nr:Drug/metabolite transporter [Macleaya cordata]
MGSGSGRERRRSYLWDVAVPFAAMVMVEFTDVGVTTLSKAAMLKGMSPFVYVVYYNALGTLLLLPPFLFYRTKTSQPPLSFTLFSALFFIGLIGIGFGQAVAFIGIRHSSPTLSSALANLIPAFTFLLAIIFRMEKVDLRIPSSQAKSLGAIVSISGAFIVTLYKGPPIILSSTTAPPDHHHQLMLLSSSSQSNWVLGGLLLSFCCFLSAVWNIVQTAVIKEYPSEISVVFISSFIGTIICAIISLIIERDPSAWKLRPGIQLITIVYAAVFATVIRTSVHTWGLHKKGPVYVAMFRPLSIVFAVFTTVTFLGDVLHIGSVVGAIVISLGFYAVMWGKAKEEEKMGTDDIKEIGSSSLGSSTQKVPLLQGNDIDI